MKDNEYMKNYMREYRKSHPRDPKKEYQYTQKYRANHRAKIINQFGGKCQRCGISEDLQLHHKYYAEDSVKQIDGHLRNFEAMEHPERFALVCRKCHRHAHKTSLTVEVNGK